MRYTIIVPNSSVDKTFYDWFVNGSITISHRSTLQSVAFYSPNPDFRGLVYPDVVSIPGLPALTPINFPMGRITFGSAFSPVGPAVTLLVEGGHSFEWFPLGSISLSGEGLLSELGSGALSDFMFSALAEGDLSDLLVESMTSGSSAGVGQAWTRHGMVFSPPPRARYLAFGGYFTGQPYNTIQRLAAAQPEILPVGTSTFSAYSEPREVRTNLLPDRMQWSYNPSFTTDTNHWTGTTRTNHPTLAGVHTGAVTLSSSDTEVVTHTIPLLRAGVPYLVKVSLWGSAAAPLTSFTQSASEPFRVIRDPGSFRANEASAVMQVTPDSTGSVTLTYTLVSGATGVTVYLYDLLVEDTEDTDGDHFDGDTVGDYFWETGQTPGAARSYYYKNFLERYATVKRVLDDNTPMGIGIADPTYALLPTA